MTTSQTRQPRAPRGTARQLLNLLDTYQHDGPLNLRTLQTLLPDTRPATTERSLWRLHQRGWVTYQLRLDTTSQLESVWSITELGEQALDERRPVTAPPALPVRVVAGRWVSVRAQANRSRMVPQQVKCAGCGCQGAKNPFLPVGRVWCEDCRWLANAGLLGKETL